MFKHVDDTGQNLPFSINKNMKISETEEKTSAYFYYVLVTCASIISRVDGEETSVGLALRAGGLVAINING